jgi:hypothetical protein
MSNGKFQGNLPINLWRIGDRKILLLCEKILIFLRVKNFKKKWSVPISGKNIFYLIFLKNSLKKILVEILNVEDGTENSIKISYAEKKQNSVLLLLDSKINREELKIHIMEAANMEREKEFSSKKFDVFKKKKRHSKFFSFLSGNQNSENSVEHSLDSLPSSVNNNNNNSTVNRSTLVPWYEDNSADFSKEKSEKDKENKKTPSRSSSTVNFDWMPINKQN